MKVIGYIRTDKVGSTCEFDLEIEDELLEGLSQEDRDSVIEEHVREAMWNHAEWGYEVDER